MDATSASDMLTVLQYVDHFYATSWNHLIICGSVAVGIVGVVIPILVQIYQGRTIRHERSQIREAIVVEVSAQVHDLMEKEKALLEDKITAATQSLEQRLARDRADLEGGVRKTEAELRKGIARARGAVYHVQTNALVKEQIYVAALLSAIDGLNNLIDADDHYNVRRLLVVITKTCLPKMIKAQLDEMEEDKKAFHSVMSRIEEWDVSGDFTDAVRGAKRAFNAACERVPAAKTEGP